MKTSTEQITPYTVELPSGLEEYCIKLLRTSSLGQMSSVIMHDIRNSLAIISGSAQLIQLKGDNFTEEERSERLEQVLDQVDKIQTTINQVGQFKERAIGVLIDCDPETALSNALLGFSRRSSTKGIKIVHSTASHQLTMKCDVSLLEFVLIDLLAHCVDNASSPGELHIRSYDSDEQWTVDFLFIPQPEDDTDISNEELSDDFAVAMTTVAVEQLGGEMFQLQTEEGKGWRIKIPMTQEYDDE